MTHTSARLVPGSSQPCIITVLGGQVKDWPASLEYWPRHSVMCGIHTGDVGYEL